MAANTSRRQTIQPLQRENLVQKKQHESSNMSDLEALLSQPFRSETNTSDPNNDDLKEVGVQFLLAEFSNLTDLWKHTDSRLESGLNIYLTTNALLISAIAFFSQRVTDTTSFLIIIVFIAVALSVTGIILSTRLLSTAFIKTEYMHARNMIRRYFAERAPDIIPYLYFANKTGMATINKKILLFRTPGTIYTALHLWSSFLTSASISVLILLLYTQIQAVILIFICLSLTILFFVLLTLNKRHKIKRFDPTQYNS